MELPLKGISQIQLNVKAGLTFASALRSILRSDPDIVLVGEIRDKETAVIAIEAALTGHMVLSHTPHQQRSCDSDATDRDGSRALPGHLGAVRASLAQRLARRLCMHCKEPYEPTEADIVAAGWTSRGSRGGRRHGQGLPIGGVFGVLQHRIPGPEGPGRAAADDRGDRADDHRRRIGGGHPSGLRVSQGMVTLRQSGLRKAIEGETTLEEVLRVVA